MIFFTLVLEEFVKRRVPQCECIFDHSILYHEAQLEIGGPLKVNAPYIIKNIRNCPLAVVL